MNKPAPKAIPDGMHSLTPYLVCAGAADAIAFYQKAFRAVELSKVANAQGKVLNAQLRIGNSMLMLMDEFVEFGALGPKSLKGSPVTIHLQVEDVDAVVKQAIAAGASLRMPVKDEFWGDRIGILEDPFGHKWSVATHTRDVSPEEMRQHAAKAMAG
ncbi:MAG: VOC family protein [Pseudomonadota bacterium]|nr:VOC family protein [Pseudomonadota bacterium]